MASLVGDARTIAEGHLACELPTRWAHVSAVAAKAERVAGILPAADRPTLVAAAWLHDIGYASALNQTGFHPIDGARWLRVQSFDPRVASLVAHHSYALIEADERGLSQQLVDEFPNEDSPTADALWYCDLTTGPHGQDFDVLDRLNEIRSRYGPEHIVTRFVDRAEPTLVAVVRRTEARLASLVDGQPI